MEKIDSKFQAQIDDVVTAVKAVDGGFEELAAESQATQQALYRAWQRVCDLRREAVIGLHFGESMAMEDIAGIMGVSRQRVEQMIRKYEHDRGFR